LNEKVVPGLEYPRTAVFKNKKTGAI